MSDERCPECGGETDCEKVHNGLALLHGPLFCTSCPWTEWADAGKIINGYLHDRAGGAIPVGDHYPNELQRKAEEAARETERLRTWATMLLPEERDDLQRWSGIEPGTPLEALTVEQLRSMWGSAIPDSY